MARGILRVPEGYGAIINICFLIWPVYAVWKKRLSYKDVFHTNFVWNPDFGFLAVLAVGISCAELLIIEGIDLLFKGRLADWAGLFPSAQMPDSLIQTILIVAVAVPIIEELLFRGFLLTCLLYTSMVAKYNPKLAGFDTTNHKGATGDGIVMAEAIGAALRDMEYIQIHPTVVPGKGVLIAEGMRGQGAILVNSQGERFVQELKTRDLVSEATLEQEGKYAFCLLYTSRCV